MKKLHGIILCFGLGLVAWYFGHWWPVVGGPVFAILLGIVLGSIVKIPEKMKPGIQFTSKKVLQCAVILLGFGLNMETVISVGSTSLPVILTTISVALILSYVLAKFLDIPKTIATLVGVGSSICGGSAIAATAPVIEAEDEEIAQAISVIFLFNILAALIFPGLGQALGFSNEGFALFAGTAVNDTSSVTAAASAWDAMMGTGSQVLDAATIVKLTRTLAIIPITVVLSILHAKEMDKTHNFSLKRAFPMFIAYFLLASVLTTLVDSLVARGVIGGEWEAMLLGLFSALKKLSKFFIIMAMAAIGLGTNVVHLVKTGGKPLVLGASCWVAITMVSILMQKMLGIF